MLQESCRGQNDIGISGGVSEELLMDHRKQILAHEAADYIIVIRRHHSRIGVVNKNRFHRRIAQSIQRFAQL